MKPIHRLLPAALAALALAGVAGAAPADLEARRAELAELETRVEATQRVVGPRINAAIEVAPPFLRHHRAVQGVALSPEERKALARGGAAALPPEKAAVFQAAAPAFADLEAALKSYFAAYDIYMDSEIRLRCFGSVLQVLERREALAAELDARRLEELDVGIADVLQEETEYRAALADPDAKNHEISNSADDVYFAAQALDDALLKLERKAGLAPKRPWGKRLGDFFRKLKAKARLTRIHARTLPAIAHISA